MMIPVRPEQRSSYQGVNRVRNAVLCIGAAGGSGVDFIIIGLVAFIASTAMIVFAVLGEFGLTVSTRSLRLLGRSFA
jgi:hypothetical protein